MSGAVASHRVSERVPVAMDKQWHEQPADQLRVEEQSRLLLELAPNEKVIWSGRPRSARRLVVQSLPKACAGVAIIAFVLLWMAVVVGGRNNNWDQGRPVRPFAAHNVAIAAFAGLWMIPPALMLVTWPLRTWLRLRKSLYALTDRRAIVIEPDFLGRSKSRSYRSRALRLMGVEEGRDGLGDLIFESSSIWGGPVRTIGFLAIERHGDVETLIRKTLFHSRPQRDDSSGRSAARAAALTAVPKRYRVSLGLRLFQFVFLAAAVLLVCCLLGNLVLVFAVLFVRPPVIVNGLMNDFGMGMAAAIAAAIGSLLATALVAGWFLYVALGLPIEITIDDDREISFRSRIRNVTIPVDEITMIRTGEWFDPNRFQAVVRHKGGKLMLVNQFLDFKDFLANIKELNPAIEIKGF